MSHFKPSKCLSCPRSRKRRARSRRRRRRQDPAILFAAAPSGTWTGKAQCLTAYTSGGWRFVERLDGTSVYVRSPRMRAIYREGARELAAAAIASPTGGATIDTEARFAIDQILGALGQHGLIAT